VRTVWERLPHTADTGFRVRGEALARLFENAAAALTETALDPRGARPVETRPLYVEAPGAEQLLVDFLNEILYLLDGLRFVPSRVRVLEWSPRSVRAEADGEARDDRRHPPRLVVKAVTYHQLVLAEESGGWRAEVFLDV
jgi:SHS2 domain-containing protein